jgi:hypothetical protein
MTVAEPGVRALKRSSVHVDGRYTVVEQAVA